MTLTLTQIDRLIDAKRDFEPVSNTELLEALRLARKAQRAIDADRAWRRLPPGAHAEFMERANAFDALLSDDDEPTVGACRHGNPIHYKYPCAQCENAARKTPEQKEAAYDGLISDYDDVP